MLFRSLTLCIPVMCKAHASFCGMLSCELPVKTLQSSICLSLHFLSLSHTTLTIKSHIKYKVQKIKHNYNQIWHGIKANKTYSCKLQLYNHHHHQTTTTHKSLATTTNTTLLHHKHKNINKISTPTKPQPTIEIYTHHRITSHHRQSNTTISLSSLSSSIKPT